jgi:DNA-binding NarL/FixJ family response regulator
MSLHILLIDDHPPMRFGIRSLIQQTHPDTDIAEAGNAEDALTLLAKKKFDLVFLDVRLPMRAGDNDEVETGKSTLVKIREMDGPPVVVMSAESQNRALVETMMSLGAATWVPKSSELNVTLEAIRRAVSGGVWLPPELIGAEGPSPSAAETLMSPLPKPVTHEELGITPAEFDVLRLALAGYSAAKIALKLERNADNVRKRMSRLFEKFGTANQVSLHAHFAKKGLTLGVLNSQPAKYAESAVSEKAVASKK